MYQRYHKKVYTVGRILTHRLGCPQFAVRKIHLWDIPQGGMIRTRLCFQDGLQARSGLVFSQNIVKTINGARTHKVC